jgi:tetratricopeptide (TPR) repeat protein
VEPPFAPEDIKTVEELYLTGLRLEQFYNPALKPYPYYEEALKRDPDNYRVNTQLGILYCKRGLFKQSEERLNHAIKRVTKNYTSPRDGEAFYYLGLALKAQGKYKAAYDAFYKATWSYAFHTAAYYHLAEIDCIRGNFATALKHINRSIATNAWNTKAINLKSAVLRKLGRFEEAVKLTSEVLAFDPLDFRAGFELYLVKSTAGLKRQATEALNTLEVKARGEVQSYLEVAVDYGNCGLWDEAIEVLSQLLHPGQKQVPSYQMLYYYLGYFWEKKENIDKAVKFYRMANQMPPDYCFPFRLESIDVLRAAMKNNPKDAKAPYYLGNLLYDNQPQAAIKQWEKSRSLDPTFSLVHRNLGFAYHHTENNTPKAITSYQQAIAENKNDPRVYYELDCLYERQGLPPEKRLALLEDNHAVVLHRDDALAREIILYVQLGNYDRALELLMTHHFHTWEGSGHIHDIYVNACLLRGRRHFKAGRYRQALEDFLAADQYPENQEVGRHTPEQRGPQVNYSIATVYEVLGEAEKANLFYKKFAELKGTEEWPETRFWQAMALKKLAQDDKAKQIFDNLIITAQAKLTEDVSMDFFAKFGEQQSEQARLAEAHYIIGLGYLGNGEREKAKAEFEQAIKLDVNHLWAKVQLSDLK